MICQICGKELEDGLQFCDTCGAPVSQNENADRRNDAQGITEKIVKKTDENQAPKEQEPKEQMPADNKPKKKNKALPFIIGGGATVLLLLFAVIGAALFFTFGANRSQLQAYEKYYKAYNDMDDSGMLSVMIPRQAISTVEDELVKNGTDVGSLVDSLGANCPMTDVVIISETEVDSITESKMEELTRNYSLDITWDEMEIIEIQREDSSLFTDILLTYRIGRKWYVLPGALEYVEISQQNADTCNANDIRTAICIALGNEDIYNAMKPYFNTYISLNDEYPYLPESFVNEIRNYVDLEKRPEYARNGANAFSFVIDDNGLPTVYASSDVRLDEWELYPNVSEKYFTGERTEQPVDGLASIYAPDYGFLKLQSADSPVLGYWQGDSAGMYIGYNTSVSDEGFIIYLVVNDDSGVHIYNPISSEKITGGMGHIVYSGSSDSGSFVWSDENTVVANVTYGYRGDSVTQTVTLTRQEMNLADIKSFEGAWKTGADYAEFVGQEAVNYEIDCSNGCHAYRIDTDGNREELCSHSSESGAKGTTIMLYDGFDTLHYVEPTGFYEDSMMSYDYTMFNFMDGNEDIIEFGSGHVGGAGGRGWLLYRVGSEAEIAQKALLKYKEYIDENSKDFKGVELVYLDGDRIPECVVRHSPFGQDAAYVLTYNKEQDQIVALTDSMTGSRVTVKSGTNEFCFHYNGSMLGLMGERYYVLENGEFVKKGEAHCMESVATSGNEYYVDGNKVSKDDYDAFRNKFGSYDVEIKCEATTVANAYQRLLGQ